MDITLKCPIGGEEWPAESYKSVVDIYADPLQYKHIHFTCPGQHSFSLARAVKAKMFTKEEADKMLEGAKIEVSKFLKGFGSGK